MMPNAISASSGAIPRRDADYCRVAIPARRIARERHRASGFAAEDDVYPRDGRRQQGVNYFAARRIEVSKRKPTVAGSAADVWQIRSTHRLNCAAHRGTDSVAAPESQVPLAIR